MPNSTNQVNELTEEELREYDDFFKVSFKDLVVLSQEDRDIFLNLYYNRDSEFQAMKSILRNIKHMGENILIYGRAGSGKSNFMYKVFFELQYMPEFNLHPIICDYRPGTKPDLLLMAFISEMKKYFDQIKYPVNVGLLENTAQNINHNIYVLQNHLANTPVKLFTKHLIIFLDDFDYVEKHYLFDLLETFAGFGVHHHATLVLCARPNLFVAINDYDNRIAKHFLREVRKIELQRLDIKKLIYTRLAAILVKHENQAWYLKLVKQDSKYMQLMGRLGISRLSDLKTFELPFAGEYMNFIRQVSNSNNREIFEMIYKSLNYYLKNRNQLEDMTERENNEEFIRKVIPRKIALELFYSQNPEESKTRIINIHKYRSKSGNSLMFNILEAVKSFRILDANFYMELSKKGHKKNEVDTLIVQMKGEGFGLIAPVKIIPTIVKHRVDLYPEYSITEKGDYYVSTIVFWEEYIALFGACGEKISCKSKL